MRRFPRWRPDRNDGQTSTSRTGARLVAARRGPLPSRDDRPLRLKAPQLTWPRAESYPEPAEPKDPVKQAVFERINRDRATSGLAPVAWDEAASLVADVFCAQQVAEKTRGHFLTDGIPPYARMAFSGVFGMQSENSVSWITTAETFSDSLQSLALEGHEQMMKETPPADGHRRTILDPEATHVGVGYAAARGRFQMSQEFLVRKLSSLSLSLLDARQAAVALEGKPAGSQNIEFVTVAWEPGPRPISREEASGRTFYAYPIPALSYIPEGRGGVMSVIGTTSEDRVKIRSDRSFSFEFRPARAGLYTLVFYVGGGRPSRSPRPGGAVTLWFD